MNPWQLKFRKSHVLSLLNINSSIIYRLFCGNHGVSINSWKPGNVYTILAKCSASSFSGPLQALFYFSYVNPYVFWTWSIFASQISMSLGFIGTFVPFVSSNMEFVVASNLLPHVWICWRWLGLFSRWLIDHLDPWSGNLNANGLCWISLGFFKSNEVGPPGYKFLIYNIIIVYLS